MKNLDITVDYSPLGYYNIDLENGFFGFEFTCDSKNYTMQLCLNKRKDGTRYKRSFDSNDAGHDWGICGEVNEEAFELLGQEKATSLLFNTAKKMGLRDEV